MSARRSRFRTVLRQVVLAGALLAIAGKPAHSQQGDCFDDLFCIEPVHLADTVDVYLRSTWDWSISVQVGFDLENMSADRALPLATTLTGRSRIRVARLIGGRRGGRWSYRFSLKWLPGSLDADHDDSYVYSLPWAAGSEFGVGQGYNGSETHGGKNAIDWDMPVGTPVHAARDGVVIDVKERFFEGGMSDDLRSRANYVSILHSDGTIGQYVHLDYRGVRVNVGDRVRRGERIARSGDTGFSSGPHLHFEVFSVSSDLSRRTIPVRFRTSQNARTTLVEGGFYSH